MLICMLKNTNLEKIARTASQRADSVQLDLYFCDKTDPKEEIKVIHQRCAVGLNLASEWELLGSAHAHLTSTLLTAVRRYITTGFIFCPLWAPQRSKWTSGKEISKKAYC